MPAQQYVQSPVPTVWRDADLRADLRALGCPLQPTRVRPGSPYQHVEPHQRAPSVRIEQGMRAFTYGVFSISFISPSLSGLRPSRADNCTRPYNAWTECFHRLQMHGVLYLVNLALLLCELLIGRLDGGCRRHLIPSRHRHRSEQIARLHRVAVIVVVKCLSVHRSDGSERKMPPAACATASMAADTPIRACRDAISSWRDVYPP